MLPRLLIAAGALIVLTLGVLHLILTFRGPKLTPRDPELIARMKEVSPVITRETTMWKTWIGFNASHSCSAILFGLIYGYFALVQPAALFGSWFLSILGAVFLGFYLFLGKRYWFSTPLRGLIIASILYVAGFLAVLT
jgi:hypothetical protein